MKFTMVLCFFIAALATNSVVIAETLQEQATRLANLCRTVDAGGKPIDINPGQTIVVGNQVRTCVKTAEGMVLMTRLRNSQGK